MNTNRTLDEQDEKREPKPLDPNREQPPMLLNDLPWPHSARNYQRFDRGQYYRPSTYLHRMPKE